MSPNDITTPIEEATVRDRIETADLTVPDHDRVRRNFAMGVVLLAIASVCDLSRPFDRSWSILYVLVAFYVSLFLSGLAEVVLLAAVGVATYLIPLLFWPELFWSGSGLFYRTTGLFAALVMVSLIWDRRKNLDSLRAAKAELEAKVLARTSDLQFMNEYLRREITDRKQTEIALQKSEARFRLLFEGANDAIFLADADTGILVDCNKSAEEMLGREREEIVGQPQTILHPPELNDQIRGQFREHASLRRKTHVETEVQRKDGTRIAVAIAPSVTMIGTQRIIQGIFRDVTEQKRLDKELQNNRQRLEILSRKLLTTQEIERRHLARELHDEIGQTLTAIKMNLRRIHRIADSSIHPHLDESVSIVETAIAQVRSLSLQLRPPQLDQLGLVAALHWLVKQQADAGGIKEQLDVNIGNLEISSELKIVCFRITQEALTNAIRHGLPSIVDVKLWTMDDQLQLSIHDDGVGFDTNESHRRALRGVSFGLLSIQERASLVGGQLTIQSTPGNGTTVHAKFPLAAT